MGKVFVACALLAAMPVGAQQVVLKCKGPNGETIYQNHPCAWRGGKLQGVLVFDDPRESPDARRRLEVIERQQQARYQAERRPGGGVAPLPSPPSNRDRQRQHCAEAKARANRAAFDGTPDGVRRVYEREAVDACFGL